MKIVDVTNGKKTVIPKISQLINIFFFSFLVLKGLIFSHIINTKNPYKRGKKIPISQKSHFSPVITTLFSPIGGKPHKNIY